MILKAILTKYLGENNLPTDSRGFVPDSLDDKPDEFDWTGERIDWSRSSRSKWKAFVKSVIEQINRLCKEANQRDPNLFQVFWIDEMDEIYSALAVKSWLIDMETSAAYDEARRLEEDLCGAAAGVWQQYITGTAVDECESWLLKFHGQEVIDKIKKAGFFPWVEGSGLPIRKKKGGKKK
ncbi:hypothetical protein MYX65_07005 [Acidobacteria bacterium AH-259-L09]|nr:hypothetical protein [Acidobacteria bacterium AH-259-L09]